MNKKTTIKDICAKTGFSLGTVHLALNGKTGISDETREKILQAAKELDYHPNYAAASLNRKAKLIVGCFPNITGDNRYYYPPIWKGMRDAWTEYGKDMNISLLECPYVAFRSPESEDTENQIDLRELREKLENGEIDGMVLDGNTSPFDAAELRRYTESGLKLVIVDSDVPGSGRLACVQANYNVIGRTLAEIITERIMSYGGILFCAGKQDIYSHHGIEIGFDQYMEENKCTNKVYKLYNHWINDENYESIKDMVGQPDVAAVCCVSSRTSVMLSRALEETGRAGKLVAVGSDLFPENIDALKRSTFQNLIQKNPYAQSYTGCHVLIEYLLKDVKPQDQVTVGSQVVFRSNIMFYEDDRNIFQQRMIL